MAVSSNQTLIPDGKLVLGGSGTDRTITVTPALKQSGGPVTITVSVSDGTVTTTETFDVTINAVNDAPTLDPITSPPAIDEDSGQQTVSLAGITAGGGETQTLQVTATSNNLGLIPNPTVTYTSPNTTGSLSYTPVAGQSGTATITVTVRDAGLDGIAENGDDGTVSQMFPVVIVTVTINQAMSQFEPTSTSPINFTVIFSSPVTDFTSTDVIIGGTSGATKATVTGSGSTYNVAVTGMTSSGTVTASVPAGAASDAAGNFNVAGTSTDNSVTFDNLAPSVSINQAAGQNDPTNATPINFTVVFSEAVTGFTGTDVVFTGSTATGSPTVTVTGSGTTYNVAVTGVSGSGTVVASIIAGAASDAAGNTSAASTSTDSTVSFDNVAPTVTINQTAGQPDPTNSAPINFTVVFSESVTGFGAADVTVTGTAAGPLTKTVTGSGPTYNVAISGITGTGTVTATVVSGAAIDAAGNRSQGSTNIDSTVTFQAEVPSSRFFRTYNPNADFHFFTSGLAEFAFVKSLGYYDEASGGVGFGLLTSQLPGSLPLHRIYIPTNGVHYYTTSDAEANFLAASGNQREPDQGFIFTAATAGTVEIFHLCNNNSGAHLFTDSHAEVDGILALYGPNGSIAKNIWVQQTSLGFAVHQNAGTFSTGGATQLPATAAAVAAVIQTDNVGGASADSDDAAGVSLGLIANTDSQGATSSDGAADSPGDDSSDTSPATVHGSDVADEELDSFWKLASNSLLAHEPVWQLVG